MTSETRTTGYVLVVFVVGMALWHPVPLPAGDGSGRQDLTKSSLEELMNIEVSSVSRKEQRLSQAAAAVFVITQDDIRRAGVTSIPEALRLAPGVDVARIDSSKWAITARGFNGRFANKLLLLIDGRSVYNGLYSGVYWDQNDVFIEDVERIEVVRGPGATMWGANAVNGVINVITKHTRATEGALVSAGAGTEALATSAVRYGGHAGERMHYRLFAKSNWMNDSLTASGRNAGDRWRTTRAGARVDWEATERDEFTFHGDGYQSDASQTFATNFPLIQFGRLVHDRYNDDGGYGLVRWTHHNHDGSGFALQGYAAQEDRNEGGGWGHFRTVDLDFQHRFRFAGRNDLTWGVGYRNLSDSVVGWVAYFDPANRTTGLYSSFFQDDISLIEDKLTLSVGSKFQHNDYTGYEVQPSARLLWSPLARQSFWVAASRAVRTPSRRDTDVHLTFDIPQTDGSTILGEVNGNPNFRSEVEHAYEAGFRTQATPTVSVDIATFGNRYLNLQTWQTLAPQVDFSRGYPQVIVANQFANGTSATTYGAETAITWLARSNWKFNASHSWLKLVGGEKSLDSGSSLPLDNSPQHQAQARSSLDLTSRVSVDTLAFYVGELRTLRIPAYVRLDANLIFKISPQLEFSLGGRNLLDDRHPEFYAEDHVRSTEVRRSAWLRLTWRM